jgi:hypothetical protein
MCAVSKGHADCVCLLLEVGADKETKDNVRVCVPSSNYVHIYLSINTQPKSHTRP